eukprot:gene4819-5887_t
MNTTHLIYILILLVAVVVIVHATKTSTTVASELDAFTAILVSIYLLPIAGDMESGLKTSRLRKPKAPLFIHQGRQLEGWLPPLNSASHTTVQGIPGPDGRACEVTPRFAYEGTHSAYARNIAGVQEGRPWSSTSSQVWIFKKLLPNGVTTWITRHLHFPYTFTVCSTYLYRTCKLHEGTVMKVSDFYLSNFDKSYYLDFSCGESNMGIQASFSASIYTLVLLAFSSEDDTSAPRRVVDMLGMLNVSMYLCMWIQLALPLCFPDTLQDIVKAKVETAGKHLGMALREYGRFERLLLYTGIPAFVIILCMSTMLLAPEIFQESDTKFLVYNKNDLIMVSFRGTNSSKNIKTDINLIKDNHLVGAMGMLVSIVLLIALLFWARKLLDLDVYQTQRRAHVLTDMLCAKTFLCLPVYLSVCLNAPLLASVCIAYCMISFAVDFLPIDPVDLKLTVDMAVPLDTVRHALLASIHAYDEDASESGPADLAEQSDASAPSFGRADVSPSPAEDCAGAAALDEASAQTQERTLPAMQRDKSEPQLEAEALPPPVLQVPHRALKLEQARFWDLMPLVILFWLVVAQYYSMAALASVRLATVLLVITTIHTLPRSLWQTLDCFLRRPKVHQGFWEAYLSIEGELTRALSTYAAATPNLRAIVFTGHSLGGALATI